MEYSLLVVDDFFFNKMEVKMLVATISNGALIDGTYVKCKGNDDNLVNTKEKEVNRKIICNLEKFMLILQE